MKNWPVILSSHIFGMGADLLIPNERGLWKLSYILGENQQKGFLLLDCRISGKITFS